MWFSLVLLLSTQTPALPDTPVRNAPARVVQFVAPAVLFSTGLAWNNVQGPLSKQAIAHWVQHGTGGYRTHIDDYLWAAPIAAVYVADVAGAHPLHGFWERTVLLGECVALNQVLTDAGKRAFHLERPDASNNQSFPSGHSSVAFMGATFLAKEVGHHRPWVQVAGYTVATATGALRMVNNRHYLPDVLAGAAIGILSTEAMYGLHAVAWPHHWRRGHAIVPVWH